jgi:hypothetical protein
MYANIGPLIDQQYIVGFITKQRFNYVLIQYCKFHMHVHGRLVHDH